MSTTPLPWWDTRLAYAGDPNDRVRSYRRLQSRWREEVLDLPPGSYVDRNGIERELGSRLPDGSPHRAQLLSDEALEYAQDRLPVLEDGGRKAEPGRLWLNMLSSQPLCFSLFGHLDRHRDAGARVLDAVLPWAVESIEDVLVEHAPADAARRLGDERPDNTAFDTMLLVRSDGITRVLGVETKYTEPFTQKRYDKPAYRAATDREDSWFTPQATEDAREPSTNQLWRNLMLAQETEATTGTRASVVVLTAADDHHAQRAVSGVQRLLVDPQDRVTHTLLEDLVAAAEREPTLWSWAQRFHMRYLDLGRAEAPV